MTEQMPKEIATAIITVMKTTGRVTKAGRNTQGGFNFASVDAFLELVNPACSEAGLIIMPLELTSSLEHIEVADKAGGGTKQRRFARITYGFMLIHESGATWRNEHDTRTILVDHTGSQCFAAAQSYALKQYMRALFLIPTGEKDADASEQFEADLTRAKVKALRAKQDSGSEQVLIDFGQGLEPIPAADVATRVMGHLMELGDIEQAATWWDNNKHGREMLHSQYPKIALELKRRVEGFLKPADAA